MNLKDHRGRTSFYANYKYSVEGQMYALFSSKAADKIYYYQVGWDKGNERGFLDE